MEVDGDEYAGAPPRLMAAEVAAGGAGIVGADDTAALSLEERFAAVTQELMRDEVDVAEALLAFKDACAGYVAHIRCACYSGGCCCWL